MKELDKETVIKFCTEYKNGLPIKYVCDLLCINHTVFFKWIKQGEVDAEIGANTIYNYLYTCVKQAYSEFLKECRRIILVGDKGWQGTAWWLERTNKDFQLQNFDPSDGENITINTQMRKREAIKKTMEDKK